jgi:hypothetical protein
MMFTETQARPDAVELHLYKQDFIEIEVYKLNGCYNAWPYVRSSAHSDVKVHFVLPGTFQTQKLAVEAAVKEGQKKIDIGLCTEIDE